MPSEEKDYWCFILSLGMPGLGKVRLVISFENEELTGEKMIEKQTFIDPKTGEEIESTNLARVGSLLLFQFVYWLVSLPVIVLLLKWLGAVYGFILAMIFAISFGKFFGRVLRQAEAIPVKMATVNSLRKVSFLRWSHDLIARWQHYRHTHRCQ